MQVIHIGSSSQGCWQHTLASKAAPGDSQTVNSIIFAPCHDFAFGRGCTAGMKTAKKLQRLGWLLVLSLLCSQSRADLVYDNSSNDLNTRFNVGTNEVGDEIV